MKILMVTMALGIGGAETHIVELSRALDRMGHSVTVASAGGVFAAELEECGIRHVTLPLADKRPASVLASYRGLLRLIREEDFDVVHGHARIPNFILSLVRRKVDFRFVTTAHLNFSVNALWRKISNWGERSLAVSDDIKEYLTKEYGTPAENIDVTINGIDMEKFSPDTDCSPILREFSLDPDHRRAVYISRIDHDRSAPAFMLCEKAPELARRYGDLDIVIVGAGDDFDRLTEACRRANELAGRRIVTLCGGRSDINRFCAMADVFIAVSRSALEAMSAAVPVIVAGNQGYLGIFGEDKLEKAQLTNFCCRGCDLPTAEVLFRDLCALLDSDKDTLRALGEYGQDIVRRFYSAEKMAKDYLDCYGKLGASTDHRKSDVLFCGYYGYGNMGDEASLECTVQALRRLRPDLRITVLCAGERDFRRKMNVRAVSRLSPVSIMREIGSTKVLIFGGGSLLQDKTSLRSLRYYAWILRRAARKKKKIFVYANGVGPLTKPHSRKLVFSALKNAEHISLRENSSADALCAAGISPDRIRVSADCAFLTKSPADGDVTRVCEALGIRDKYFVLSLREPPAERGDFVEEISRAVRDISAKYDSIPVFIAMQEKSDRPICTEVLNNSVGEGIMAPPLSTRDTLALLRGAQLTLGMRLHSIIFSLCCNTPTVALSYDPKIDAVCEYLGKDCVASVRDFTAAQLLAMAGRENPPLSESALSDLRKKAAEDVEKIIEMTENSR